MPVKFHPWKPLRLNFFPRKNMCLLISRYQMTLNLKLCEDGLFLHFLMLEHSCNLNGSIIMPSLINLDNSKFQNLSRKTEHKAASLCFL